MKKTACVFVVIFCLLLGFAACADDSKYNSSLSVRNDGQPGEVPAQDNPAQDDPAQDDPVQNNPEQNVLEQNVPVQNVPEQETPEQKEPIQNDPETHVPPEDGDLVNILDYIPTACVELKYATEDNFVSRKLYDSEVPLLRYGTVKKLIEAEAQLNSLGYRIKIWDAYRPVSAQEALWEICPDPKYVSNPATGYLGHSRGNTLDITLVTYDDMQEVEMPSDFDDFTEKADRDYSDCSDAASANAQLLEGVMENCGFKGYEGEWWHYSDTTEYPIIR